MSLSGALSNALSGLTAASRAATVVSSNIANATNEAYGRRELEISARAGGTSGGVMIDGVVRYVDSYLVGDWRNAEADLAYADTTNTYYTRLETMMGTPEDYYSISGRIATFENALVAASSRPDLPERLTDVAGAAKNLAGTLNDTSDGIQKLREEADAEIASAVDRANALMRQVDTLNEQISHATHTGGDTASLMDHRQAAINELSEIVPVIETPRESGAIALYTPGGAVLVDSAAATLGFQRTNTITANMTLDAGLLSGLTIDGVAVNTSTETGPIYGARLSALFDIRDNLAVEAQTRVDSVARDMVERFQDAGLDTTRAAGDPGLFTDGGAAFNTADEVGLSARIEVNALVDPDEGGAVWRIRDGLGAASEGPVGEAGLIYDMIDALSEKRTPSATVFGASGISASGLASSLLTLVGSERNTSDQDVAFANTRESELKSRMLSDGVDTDQETQNLLLIEQSYAANARLVQTIEDMLDMLMRI